MTALYESYNIRTMSAITAIVRTNMAAMAHVFLAHRVRSIHIEKDTILLENICDLFAYFILLLPDGTQLTLDCL